MTDLPAPSDLRPAPRPSDGAFGPYLRAALAHVRLIAVVTVVALLVAAVGLTQRSPSYAATVQVLVTPLSDAGSYLGLPVLSTSPDPTRTLQTAVSILATDRAAIATARRVPGLSPEAVAAAVAVQPKGDSDVITITATLPSSSRATLLANTYAAQALAVRRGDLGRAAAASVRDLQARQAAVPATDTGQASSIATALTDLQRLQTGQDPNFSQLQTAGPATAMGTSKAIVLALALVAGLVLGLLAALVIELVDRRVRDEEELVAIYPLPVLARVPLLPRRAVAATTPDDVPVGVREAFRTLQIQLEDDGRRRRAVMVTSPSIGDGKTSSAINFALTLVRAGARVILLDLDLRNPDLGRRLGAQADVMRLFGTAATIEDVLTAVPGAPGVRVMSPGVAQDVSPLFEAIVRRIPTLVQQAKQVADYVIIDTAPLGEVSDALRIAGAVDDVVLVGRPGHTDRSRTRQAHEVLERTGHRPTGLLVVGAGAAATYGTYGESRS